MAKLACEQAMAKCYFQIPLATDVFGLVNNTLNGNAGAEYDIKLRFEQAKFNRIHVHDSLRSLNCYTKNNPLSRIFVCC